MYKSSVLDLLASLPEDQFLEQVSHGVALIGQSLESLERAGEELHKLGYVQGSEVLRRLAEEEAAKALILFDAVRCPRREESRRQITLARFRDHLAKGIYAKASSWRYFKFQEFRDYVQACRNSLHLDGPNDVDWIFRNEITASRENAMYVDYVRDITEPSGDQFWSAPPQDVANASSYASSDAARLVRAITNVGRINTLWIGRSGRCVARIRLDGSNDMARNSRPEHDCTTATDWSGIFRVART